MRMEEYLFLPFLIRVCEVEEEVCLPAESLCLIFVVRGHLRLCQREERLLHEMDLFSVRTTDEDKIVFEDTAEAVCAFCCISMDYIRSQCQFLTPQICVDTTRRGTHSDQKLYQEMMRLLADYFSAAPSGSRLKEGIRRLVHTLLRRDAASADNAGQQAVREHKLRYLMHQEYQREWTLPMLAGELGLTQQYTSSYVRHVLGRPMNQYLSGRRLAALKRCLMYTKEPVTSLAGTLGFTNIVSLNQSFRERYNTTPTQYRREHPAPDEADILVSDNPYYAESYRRIGEIKTFKTPAGKTDGEKTIRCLPADQTDIVLPAIDTVFAGPVEQLSDHAVCEQLKEVCRALPIRYVRINTVFWPPNMEEDENGGGYRFSRSFPAIGVIHRLGLYPMILFRVDPAEPTDRMLADFLEQAVREFGRERVEKWRLECVLADFNCPLWELSAQEKKAICAKLTAIFALVRQISGTMQMGLYLYHAERIRPDDEELLGMPGVKELLWDFITVDLIAGYTVRPDRYMADSEKEYRFSANPHVLFRRLKTLCRVLRRFDPDGRILLYGNVLLDMHQNLALNDTPYAAVFLLFQMISCSEILSGLMLPVLSERNCFLSALQDAACVSPYPDGRLTHGMFSLLTDRGIPKPVFFAFRFWHTLQKEVIRMGEDYVLTGDLNGVLTLLLFHYEHPTLFFCNHPYNLTAEDVDAVFHETEPESVKVRLPVCAGTYLAERYTLDENHGSVMAYGRGLDASAALPEEIAEHVKETVKPGYDLWTMYAGVDGLSFEISLPAHTAVLIRIRRQTP